jgi:hypothetical protein
MNDKKNPFGVLEFFHWNHAWNKYKYNNTDTIKKSVALLKEAGIGIVRLDFLWSDIEPFQGKLNFSKYDDIVTILTDNGVEILGILNYSTDWASPDKKWNSPSTDNGMFINYVTEVVKRYKDKVSYWEIWNEPDSHIYWSPQDGLKQYCSLLKDSYKKIKEIAPQSIVLNGGLANGPASVNRLYDNGAKDYFDVMNIHIFDSPLIEGSSVRVLSQIRLTEKIMRRNNDSDKPIWITELGCPGVAPGIKTKDWWMGKNPSEEEQAAWLKEVYAKILKETQVERIFWAFFRDCKDHWKDGVDYLGLIRWDFSAKPAFAEYKKIISSWNNLQR